MDRMLYIWFKQPEGILNGGMLINQRNFELMQHVLGKNAVDSFYIHPVGEHISLMRLARNAFGFLGNLHNGLTKSMIKEIIAKSKNYQYIFLSTSLFGCIAKALKKRGYQGKIIVHFHNVESIYYEASINKWLPFRQIIVNSAEHNDKWSCHYADTTIALNKRDIDILESRYNRKIEYILPISFRDQYQGKPTDAMTSAKPLCTFIGSNFGPNREGIAWFIKHVMPRVSIKLQIVGKDMDALKNEYRDFPNISVHSNVPDLTPYFEKSDFMLFPIFSGSGMKVKTCEALMYGKNTIATNEAFEGYDIDTNKVGACCNTVDEFIDTLNEFCHNPIKRFNEYSRKTFLDNYSYDSSMKLVHQMMQDISYR